ncbi:MAG: MFS transporter [Novosphingobium sp.]
MTAPPQSPVRLAAFSAINVALGGFNIPLQTYLPAFYATVIGMDLPTVGLVFMVSRLISALADPVIGWASDRTRSRFGRRKPWVVGGGMLFLAALSAVFFPPRDATPLYLGAGLLTLCLAWTATSTPLYAWGGEMSASPQERSRIQAYIQTGASVGIFLILLLPAALDALRRGNPEMRVGVMGGFTGIVVLAALPLIAALFREPQVPVAKPRAGKWRDGIQAIARDRMLWRIVASDFCVALGQGFRGAVFLFFVTRTMGMASPALLLIVQYAFGIVAAPLWARVSYRLRRVRTLVVAEALQVGINLMLLAVSAQRPWLFVLLVIAQGLTQGSGNLMLRAMIYDLADRHRTESGIERAGLFSSIFNVTTNAAYAIAVGIALPVVALMGFDPKAPDTGGAGAVHLFMALGPAIGHFASIVAIRRLKLADS